MASALTSVELAGLSYYDDTAKTTLQAQIQNSADTVLTLNSANGVNNACSLVNASSVSMVDTDAGAGTFTMQPAATTTSYTVTWPSSVAAGTGYVLKSDVTGTLSWEPETTGLSWKDPVVAASTAPVTLAAPGATLDGVTLAVNDRILLKNGSTANPGTTSVDNGIYVWTGAAAALTRSTDMPVGELSAGDAVISTGGTVNNDKAWVQTLTPGNVGAPTPDGDLEFVSFGAAGIGAAGTAGEVQINDPTTVGNFAAASTAYPETQYQYEATGPDATLNVGNASAGATAAGSFTLQAGTAAATSGFNGSRITITGGDGETATSGGNVELVGGTGGTTGGQGGNILITSGAGGSTSGDSGNIAINTNIPIDGDGGSIQLNASAGAGASGDGGNIFIQAGPASGAGSPGVMTLETGESTTAIGFTFQNTLAAQTLVEIKGAQENATQTASGAGAGTLHVEGGGSFTQDVYGNTFNAVSDVRVKKNISRIDDPLQKLMEIEGYSYDWKDEKLNNGKKQLGVLAQQLEKIGLDDVVTGTEEKKAVNYLALIPLMIEAIKEIANDVYE